MSIRTIPGGLLVLVVEDDGALRATYSRGLANKGCRVEVAEDAESALHMVRQFAFDVIVSDINLPGVSGAGLVGQLSAEGFDLPVVLVTGDPTLETAIQAIERGVL